MDLYEIVMWIAGPISPVGETHTDNERFDNLKVLTEMVERLISDIDAIATEKDRQEFSIRRAGEYCSNFLDSLGIEE